MQYVFLFEGCQKNPEKILFEKNKQMSNLVHQPRRAVRSDSRGSLAVDACPTHVYAALRRNPATFQARVDLVNKFKKLCKRVKLYHIVFI